MEVDYNFPGTMKISLDEADLASLRTRGFCTDRDGFSGIESKIWVYGEQSSELPRAYIDRGGDLSVYIPNGPQWRCEVSRDCIDAANAEAISHFLGETGTVIVEWGNPENTRDS